MKKTLGVTLLLTFTWALIGCTTQAAAPDPRDQQIDKLNARIAQLEAKPSGHHYELRNEGSRTFRFDPATGESCIQLASAFDWRHADTIRQGCQYEDWVNAPNADAQTYLRAECLLVHDKASCAELWPKK